jgi:hypothetical protein
VLRSTMPRIALRQRRRSSRRGRWPDPLGHRSPPGCRPASSPADLCARGGRCSRRRVLARPPRGRPAGPCGCAGRSRAHHTMHARAPAAATAAGWSGSKGARRAAHSEKATIASLRHKDFTQELPRKLLPTRAKEASKGNDGSIVTALTGPASTPTDRFQLPES